MLSIRNVSRFGLFPAMLIWMVVSLALIGLFGAAVSIWIHSDQGLMWPTFLFAAVVWLGGASLLQALLFRCPRCHRTSLASYGRLANGVPYSFSMPPFWTPRTCSRCGLDFTTRTFWAPDNKDLRDLWIAMGHEDRQPRR
jgi:hypothetical protein